MYIIWYRHRTLVIKKSDFVIFDEHIYSSALYFTPFIFISFMSLSITKQFLFIDSIICWCKMLNEKMFFVFPLRFGDFHIDSIVKTEIGNFISDKSNLIYDCNSLIYLKSTSMCLERLASVGLFKYLYSRFMCYFLLSIFS